MEVYILHTVSSDFDCGDASGEIISVSTTKEQAMTDFREKEAELLSDEWGYRIVNDNQYPAEGRVYQTSYQNECSNLEMEITKMEVK